MQHSTAEAGPNRQTGSLLGPGWSEVQSFEDVEDLEEYENEEEESFVVLDLGTAVDGRTLLTEGSYQLIGMDTATPFIKIGDHILRGEIASLIGEEVILGLQRSHADVSPPSHPPMYKTSQRVTFRPVTLTERREGDADVKDGYLDSLPGGLQSSTRARLFPHNAEAGPSTPRSHIDPRLQGPANSSARRKSAPRLGSIVDDEMDDDPLVELSSAPGSAKAVPKARGGGGRGKPTGRPPNPDRHLKVTSAAELLTLDLPNLRKDIKIEVQAPPPEPEGADPPLRAPIPLLKYADVADYAALEQAVRDGSRVSLTRRQVEMLLRTRQSAAALSTATARAEPVDGGEGVGDGAVARDDAVEVDPAEGEPGLYAVAGEEGDTSAPSQSRQGRRSVRRVAGDALLSAGAPRRPR